VSAVRDDSQAGGLSGLTSLTALTRIDADLQLSPGNLAALAALPALRELRSIDYSAGGRRAAAARCRPPAARASRFW